MVHLALRWKKWRKRCRGKTPEELLKKSSLAINLSQSPGTSAWVGYFWATCQGIFNLTLKILLLHERHSRKTSPPHQAFMLLIITLKGKGKAHRSCDRIWFNCQTGQLDPDRKFYLIILELMWLSSIIKIYSMVWVRRDLKDHLFPALLPEAGTPSIRPGCSQQNITDYHTFFFSPQISAISIPNLGLWDLY